MSAFGKLFFWLREFLIKASQQILPAVSPISGDIVTSTGALTGEHWQQLEFLSGSLCYCCGRPLEGYSPEETRCGPCDVKPPNVSRTRSALVYSDMSRRLILSFKHGGRLDNVETFSSWMQMAAGELLQQPGILLPVPLHLYRRVNRRFNQSALLSASLAKSCQLQHEPLWLMRHKNTASQVLKSASNRVKNVNGAFRVPPKFIKQVSGQRIILIDDVRTSGATLDACAKTLLKAGAAQVDAITLARVVKTIEITK